METIHIYKGRSFRKNSMKVLCQEKEIPIITQNDRPWNSDKILNGVTTGLGSNCLGCIDIYIQKRENELATLKDYSKALAKELSNLRTHLAGRTRHETSAFDLAR